VRLSGPHVIVGDDAIVALDRATGRPAWRFVPAHGRNPGVFLGDTTGGLVFAGSLSGDLYALDAASGVLRWSARLATSHAAVYAPAVADGRAVVAFTEFGGRMSGGLAAFDVDGTARWKRPLPAGLGATGGVLIDRSRVLLAATDGSIRAFSLRDGRPLWTLGAPPSTPANGPADRDIRALVQSGRLLVASSLNGELTAYDLDTRRRRWRYANGPPGTAALRLAADSTHVYAPYTDGSLIAVAIATGRERWRTAPSAGGLEWPPYADGRRLMVAGSRGIVAFETGSLVPAADEQAPQEDR
jgi:outer membrane protein assembly factor BamB